MIRLPNFLILELTWSTVSTPPAKVYSQLLFRPSDFWTRAFSHLKVCIQYSSIRWHIKHIDQWLHFENQASSITLCISLHTHSNHSADSRLYLLGWFRFQFGYINLTSQLQKCNLCCTRSIPIVRKLIRTW